jgi:hypothetical protein
MHGAIGARASWMSSLHFDKHAVTLTQTVADDLAGMVGDAWEDSGILAYLSTGWTLNKYVVTDMSSPTAPQYTSVAGLQTGADGGQLLPSQTAGMIEWQTASRGKSFRGRSFFAGFTEAASDGLPLVGVVSALTLWATGLIGDASTYGNELSIVSLFSGFNLVGKPDGEVVKRPKPRANGLVTHVTAGQGEEVWKTQRRRAAPG